MKKISYLLLMLCAVWTSALAVPAKPGIRVFTQSDGSTIHLQLAGDEWHHSFVTTDGMAVSRNAKGDFCYRTSQGVSSVMAHDATQRTATEQQFVDARSSEMSLQTLFTTSKEARRSRALSGRKKSQVATMGSPRIPVILVNYTDKKFISPNPLDVWQKQLCSATGVSVYKYFVDQSFGKYTPQFDVYGPYNLPNKRDTYGGNDRYGDDKGVGRMVGEACQGMDSAIDWTLYDNDGDGECDVVIVLYAGDGEASSFEDDAEDAVWPCQWELGESDFGRNLTLDGIKVSKFAVFNELYGADITKIDGIGTMCHEFSHCLDLPDWYDTNYGNHFGMANWSLLDNGCYNDEGFTPCGYTAYERNYLNWLDYTTPVEGKTYTTRSVENGGIAIKVASDNPNEYYVLETIEKNGWNKYAVASGLQVTHVTYDANKWYNNTVNNSNEQGMTIIPADNSLKMDYYQGYYYVNDASLKGDLYPYNGNNQLTATSTPAATLYKSTKNLDKPITEITKNSDGSVSFVYMAKPLDIPQAIAPTQVTGTSAVAHWTACDDALSYTLKVNPKPSYSLILTETFAKCTKDITVDAGGQLDTYMDNAGWTGSAVFPSVGGLRLGTSKATGTLTSPALALSTSAGKVTIAITGKTYGNDADVSLNVSVGGQSQTVVFASSATQTHYIVLDCAENDIQKLTFATAAGKKRVIITGLNIYSGDAMADISSSRAPSENRNGNGEIIVTGITDTQYSITGLTPDTEYVYTVKATYAEGESTWSNVVTFATTASTAIPGDVNGDGTVDIQDVNTIINVMLGVDDATKYDGRANVNGDDCVDINDVNTLINLLLNK